MTLKSRIGFSFHSAFLGALALSALHVGVSFAGGWDSVNSPKKLDSRFGYQFNEYPLEARVKPEKMPWVDSYWPSNRGGIAYRWNSKDPLFQWQSPRIQASSAIFHYASPSRQQAMNMSPEQLAQLSPTEKVDLMKGDYSYTFTREVLLRYNVKDAYWEGICHGWAPASVNHAEPLPVNAVNPDGIIIPFGSADVKAILDFYYGTENMRARQMGKRCRNDLKTQHVFGNAACDDVNAGAFHVVLGNYVGLRGVPFVADVSRDFEVWNNAIYSYRSVVQGESGPVAKSAKGTVKRVHLVTTVSYPSDDERLPPQWNATVGKSEVIVPDDDRPSLSVRDFTDKFTFENGTYEYWIELDASGKIIGGEWVSGEHPDYVWMKDAMPFSGKYSVLNQIYKAAY